MAEKPLARIRIVVTRARAQANGIVHRLAELGGEVIECPTIEIQPPVDSGALDAAVRQVESYDWLIFTSVNSVGPFVERLALTGKTLAGVKTAKIAAIGSETAKRLESAGASVSLVPARYQAEGILDELNAGMMTGKRVLIPRAAKARDVLPETLRQWGARVDVVEAYRTLPAKIDIAAIREKLQRGEVNVITFTSSSTVLHFTELFGGAPLASILGEVAIACIGPITAKTVEQSGGRVAIIAHQFTIDGLVTAIVDYVNLSRRVSPAKAQSAPSDGARPVIPSEGEGSKKDFSLRSK
jgi:uroporphyrinogen III methyltransferase/synthase